MTSYDLGYKKMNQMNLWRMVALCVTLMAVLAAQPGMVFASGDARAYRGMRAGYKAVLVYDKHISGHDYYVKKEKVSTDAGLDARLGIFRPLRFDKIGAVRTVLQGVIPHAYKRVELLDEAASGLGDPTLIAGLFIIDDWENKTWFAFTEWITFPLGDYDRNKSVNIGNNRWAFKSEFGFCKGFGNFYFDLVGGVEYFLDNDEKGAAAQTEEKDPRYHVDSHLTYDMSKDFFVSLDYYYLRGGKTTLAGVSQNNVTDTQSLQYTLGFYPAEGYQILLQYKEDLELVNGIKSNSWGWRFCYYWK